MVFIPLFASFYANIGYLYKLLTLGSWLNAIFAAIWLLLTLVVSGTLLPPPLLAEPRLFTSYTSALSAPLPWLTWPITVPGFFIYNYLFYWLFWAPVSAFNAYTPEINDVLTLTEPAWSWFAGDGWMTWDWPAAYNCDVPKFVLLLLCI